MIEGRPERAQAERAAAQQIPVEGFDVAEIKNQAMSFGDGAVV